MIRLPSRPQLVAVALGVTLFGTSFWVYSRTRYGPLLDAKYALLTSESLLERGSWDLLPYLAHLAPDRDPSLPKHRFPYQLARVDGQLLYIYPQGTALLTLPFAAVARLGGYSAIAENGRYSSQRELRAQRLLASGVTALTVTLVFAFARREVPPGAALVVALAAAFGTTLWTTAARALWMHTWSAALAAAALLEVQAWESGRRRRPILLGSLLVALFWVRPTNAVAAAGFALFVALRHRAALLRLLATGAAGLAGFVALSFATWGTLFPRYFGHTRGIGRAHSMLSNLLRDLIDVERGLLVSTPVVIALLWALARRGVPRDRRALAALAGGVALAIWSLYLMSYYRPKGTPGPRYLTDIVPYLAALGAMAWRARREAERHAETPRWRRAAATAAVLVLVAAGVAAQSVWSQRRLRARRPPVAEVEPAQRKRPTPVEWLAAWNWRHLPQVTYLRRLREGG
jgi:hypothetical protein